MKTFKGEFFVGYKTSEARLTKKGQLKKVFRDILGNEVSEFTIGSNIDNVTKMLIEEVTKKQIQNKGENK